MEFKTIHKKIWEHYKSTSSSHSHISEETHNLQIITGLFGPEVRDTDQLDGKRDLFVIFLPKSSVRLSLL